VVYGYDDTGYYFSGPMCNRGKGPKPWQELADTDIGLLEMYNVKIGKAADDTLTVKEALEFALEFAESPKKWIHPKYKSGLAGYDNWIQAVDRGIFNTHGMAYNSALWAECRNLASHFLKEASQRLNGKAGPLLEKASEIYSSISENLQKLARLYPFPPVPKSKDRKREQEALGHLKKARQVEEAGLESLNKIIDIL